MPIPKPGWGVNSASMVTSLTVNSNEELGANIRVLGLPVDMGGNALSCISMSGTSISATLGVVGAIASMRKDMPGTTMGAKMTINGVLASISKLTLAVSTANSLEITILVLMVIGSTSVNCSRA